MGAYETHMMLRARNEAHRKHKIKIAIVSFISGLAVGIGGTLGVSAIIKAIKNKDNEAIKNTNVVCEVDNENKMLSVNLISENEQLTMIYPITKEMILGKNSIEELALSVVSKQKPSTISQSQLQEFEID